MVIFEADELAMALRASEVGSGLENGDGSDGNDVPPGSAELRAPSGGTRPLLERPGAPFPSVRFLVLSDPHHLSPALWETGDAFARWLSTNDGKVLARSEDLLIAIERTVLAEHQRTPLDFVAITGDLTANGSVEGHREMAALARRIGAAGVPVFVIPGNHDLRNPWAARFSGSTAERVPSVSPERFAAMYGEAGYDAAVSRSPDDLSYRIDLGDRLSLLMLDTSISSRNEVLGYPQPTGAVSTRQSAWLRQELSAIAEDGRAPLVFMHHNLLSHGRTRGYGSLQYVVDEAPRLARLLWDGGAPVVFTGHLHARNTTGLRGQAGEWMYDVAAGAVSVYPHEYRRVAIDSRGRLKMEPRALFGFPGGDDAFRRWALATYLSDTTRAFTDRLEDELPAAHPGDDLGDVLCAGVSPMFAVDGECRAEAELDGLARYLAVWSILHRSGVDSAGAVERVAAVAPGLALAAERWRTVAPERFTRLTYAWSVDPPPSDGTITINLATGYWREGWEASEG